MFWNKKISAMAWRYPQPRALIKVRVFPIPFKTTYTSEKSEQQILCHLQYWSECQNNYQSFTQFYLSESEMFHLDLPKNELLPIVACTWRILITMIHGKSEDHSRESISPRALAGCVRIDSYFNKNLIPNLTLSLSIASLNISLYNYIRRTNGVKMPEPIVGYFCDLNFPENQNFLTLSLTNIRTYLLMWNYKMAALDVNGICKASVIDYAFLTDQQFIENFDFKIEVKFSKSFCVNFISKPIHIKLGASAAHTFAVSEQIWAEAMRTTKESSDLDFVIFTHYVVCNDINVNLCFGQVDCEEILLPTRYCHLYAWRSQKSKQLFKVAIEDLKWIWSRPFRIDSEGSEVLEISDSYSVVVTVRNLSATQKMIVFSGQLVMCNMLLEHFELKLVDSDSKDRDFKHLPSFVINGKSVPPSLLLNKRKQYHLRLRFFGLDSAWSGDIPLKENPKCAQPWLVKGE